MITIDRLTKRYGRLTAVDNVSFSVEKGEVLGFLGPNGAGKTTTMRMITGYITPDAGAITVGEHSIADAPIAAKSLIGYLPENAPSYSDMSVGHFLRFVAAMRGLSGKEQAAAVTRAVELCALEPVVRQPIDTLSKGYRHRACLAQALVHDPPVLVLDEPTDGLDPNQKHEVRNLITRMGKEKAIIISTHILEEVDAVCSRVVVIDNGRIVADALPAKLRAQSEEAARITVAVVGHEYAPVADRLKRLDGVAKVWELGAGDKTGCRLCVEVKDVANREAVATAIFRAAREAGWILSDLHPQDGRLDAVFRSITTSEGVSQ